jgi:hypothetical protein
VVSENGKNVMEGGTGMDGVVEADFGDCVFTIIPFEDVRHNLTLLSVKDRENADKFV